MISMYNIFENKHLRRLGKYFIIVWSVLYFIVILNTIYWYFFPFPLLETIFQEFRQYSFQIQEIIILFIAFPIIPGYYGIRRKYKKVYHQKVPILLILLISTPIPLFAFVNNCFTGNLIFSLILLTYGVIFTILAFKYR